MFSVLILTLNEERTLPRCLESLRGCDDIVVLDSGSTDRTTEIAGHAAARVFGRSFDDFAGQRNYAQREIKFRHHWVFHLDADEQMTPALAEECRTASVRADVDGFLVAPKMIFENRWIPHCTDFPAFQARFVRAPQFRFVQVGHGQREAADMKMGRLRENYLHDISVRGEAEWLEKHRRYARAEAAEFGRAAATLSVKELVAYDALKRRRALKHFSGRLPCRPALRFFYHYIVRGGFIDGAPGLHYCRLLARYEQFTCNEIRRLRGRTD